MIESAIARRYAKALLGLAVEEGRVREWVEALSALRQAVEGAPELADVLVNPVYTKDQRRAILGKVTAGLGLDRTPANLVALLADRNRLGYLPAIVQAYQGLADEQLGRLRATVTSAVPIEAPALASIQNKLAQATQREIIVDKRIDPAILGGVIARVGSVEFDGSVRSQLEELRRQLKQ